MKYVFASVAAVLASAVSFNAFAGGNIEAGKALVEQKACAACHGADFNSPANPDYPKLAGQNQDYLMHALIAYRRGAEGPNGRVNGIMGPNAKDLKDEEIENIAAYLHSLPGSLVTRK